MRRHVVDVIAVQAQLLSDLLVRQVEPHEIQTQDPGPKRLMVSSQNSTGQVIEPRSAILTPVPLPMSLGFIMAMADHGGAGTARAANAVRPSIVPDQLIALGIIDQGRQSDHLRRSHGQYRLMGDAGHCSNQTLSKKAIICHRTRWSHPAHSSASTPKPRMSLVVFVLTGAVLDVGAEFLGDDLGVAGMAVGRDLLRLDLGD